MPFARGSQRFVEVPRVATLPATRQRKRAPEALVRTSYPGVYRRGRRYVAVYTRDGRQRKETVSSFAEARAVKVARQAEARAERLGPTLRDHALRWVDSHAGLSHDTVGERTRREYRRLLTTFAFRYFPPDTRLGQVDREALQGFITWLATYRGERGRLADRSIANVLVPLRLCLADAERGGHIHGGPTKALLLPRRRGGNGWHFEQGRFLTRGQLRLVLAEIPEEWSPFFDLLASTGLRVSEAIALRWMDLELDGDPYLWVRRSVVGGVIGAPKSRFGRRCIPLDAGLVARLAGRRCTDAGDEDRVFPSTSGTPLNPDNVRYRVLVPAVERAGLSGIGFHAFRHTCASMLIERGLSPLRLQRWMGHHSAAYTLDTYGHLIDAEMAPALDLGAELSCR
jgi:integrase